MIDTKKKSKFYLYYTIILTVLVVLETKTEFPTLELHIQKQLASECRLLYFEESSQQI